MLIPLGTLAFALTFLATDVVSEVHGRAYSFYVLMAGLVMRFIAFIYFYYCIGDNNGFVFGFSTPEFWPSSSQNSYKFVLGSSMPIFIAGFVAVFISSLNDIYIFHYLKRKHEGKNMFWIRNNVSTILSQLVNSFLFITIAFANIMPVKGIIMAIIGQSITKFFFALLDTPFAYMMRNYAQDKVEWYKFWKRDFWLG